MSDETFRKELENFRDSALKVLRFVSDARDNAGMLPSPEILICVGSPSIEALNEHTKNISPATAVLYIHPGENDFSVSEKKNVILLPLTEKDFFRDKTGLFIALSKCRNISLSAEAELESRYANEIRAINEAVKQALSNTAQSSAGRLVYLRNALKNLPFILRDYSNGIKIENKNLSAVVCSAGPSLKGQLETLKNNSSKFIIISVGRASKLLSEAGIIPDFTVDVDPDVSWFNGIGIPVFSSSAMPNKTSEKIPAVWVHGDAFSVNRYLESSGIKLPKITLSKTVTVTALDFARHLNCANIAMLGSDLCLSETGSYYADPQDSKNESATEVSGTDGDKVFSTKNLDSLRQSIQTYLKSAALKYPDITFHNCTARGTLIENAVRTKFENFLLKFSGTEDKKILFTKTESADNSALPLDNIKSKILIFAEMLGEIRDICFKILRELRSSNPSNDKINKLKQRFMELSEKEKVFKNDETLAWLIAPLEEQASEFAAQSMKHEKITQNNPLYQVEILRKKYLFSADIFSDIITDLNNAITSDIPSDYYERKFQSFRKCAISFIQKQNPEFAALLSNSNALVGMDFKFMPNLQNSSIIQIISDSISYPLNPPSMDIMAEELSSFLKENLFSEKNDAIIFFAPGNWLHVSALTEKYPFAAAAVVEIWPSVFSKIIDANMLFHIMPETVSVFCLNSGLKQQERLFKSFIDKVKRENKRILFFNNPYTFKIPGVAEKFAAFKAQFGGIASS